MKRHITSKLIEWKNSQNRKPLIIQGARQVGKTYIISEFGRENYQRVVYFNFELDSKISEFFKNDIIPKNLINRLSFHCGQSIDPETTLIIFDEIQACGEALTSLKYFNEYANEYHIIASGSLLGVAINHNHNSYPVGKVDTYRLYPMDFEEFLVALGQDYLCESIKTAYYGISKLDSALHEKALELFRTYLLVGGMPAAVRAYVNTKDFNLVRNEQNTIQEAYLSDMAKYSTSSDIRKTRMIFNHISVQLSRINKKFQYSSMKSGGRAKEFEGALEWLELSGLINVCKKINDPMIPAANYLDPTSFKIYASDCGLLSNQYELRPDILINDSPLIADFKGGLYENYVFNQLLINEFKSYFWESSRIAEVDFILDDFARLIPLEVKSSTNVKSRSLALYNEKYKPELSLRVSTKNFGIEGNHISVPLYAVFCMKHDLKFTINIDHDKNE